MGTDLAAAFQRQRPHLLAVAYRLTGSVADSEDAVQDAWLRLDQAGNAAEVRDLPAWLTTVVSRICLDRLRSAAHRREQYVGQWLPEPIVTPLSGTRPQDPLETVVANEDSRLAAMVVLDTLTAEQRVAFVLHDAFDVPFSEVAAILGATPAAARQSASRARRLLADTPQPAASPDHDQAIERLMAAVASNDLDAVVQALHPDARFIGDAGGTTSTAINVLRGPDHTARFLLGLVHRYSAKRMLLMEPVLVNGALGLLHPGAPGDPETGQRGIARRVVAVTVREGVVWTAYDMANPAKLRGIRL